LNRIYSRRYLAGIGLPGIAWVGLFVAVSIYALIATAAGAVDPLLFQPVPIWNPLHWNFTQLREVGHGLLPPDGVYWVVVSRTGVYVGLAIVGCRAIGFPVAYFVALHTRRSRPYILALLVTPFLVSYMLRMMAWVGILAPDGYANRILHALGLTNGTTNWLGGHPSTVVLALIYGWVPYFILPLYASLERLDKRLLEAAGDLGAGTIRTFVHVTLPLSAQGILAGVVLIGLPMTGDFYTNDLVSGSPSTSMIGNLINVYENSNVQQILGAALSVWLLVFLAVLLSYYVRSSARALRGIRG
jgi:spermidine/putrescine transport system permease protein